MSTIEHVTLSEFQQMLRSLKVPTDARLTVTFEDFDVPADVARRERAKAAMTKLRGSGNGRLVDTLLREREEDERI